MPYYLGQPVLLTYNNTDQYGNPQNTSPVTVTVTLPDGTTATPSVSNPGTGQYQASYVTIEAGHHDVAWTAGGSYPGAYTDRFNVYGLADTGILPFTDCLDTLRLPAATTTPASSLGQDVQDCNAAITQWVEWYCGAVIQQTVQESLTAGGLQVQLSKPPVQELVTWTTVPASLQLQTGFTVALANSGPMFPTLVYGVTYPLDQLYVDQARGWVRHTSGLPFYYGPYLWQYTAGYAVIPPNILYACRVVLRHLWGIWRAGQGGALIGQADEETTETPFGFAVPNRAIELLTPSELPLGIA